MSRPVIPAEIKRAVLVEAGHRCAISRCGQTELDIHHIIPWATCKKHEYENLIALCPICHRRVHQGKIDRKALHQYKEKLIFNFAQNDSEQFSAEIIEIKRRISEIDSRVPGFIFNFDFPDFKNSSERIVSRNLEAWGNELLERYQEQQNTYDPKEDIFSPPSSNTLNGEYQVIRRDKNVISLKYSLDQYFSGAAHGSRTIHVQNFLLNQFQPVMLLDLLNNNTKSLIILSSLVRKNLLLDESKDTQWVLQGTEPEENNFSCFNLESFGVVFTFPEYQVDCYAAGEQLVFIHYVEMKEIMNPIVFKAVSE